MGNCSQPQQSVRAGVLRVYAVAVEKSRCGMRGIWLDWENGKITCLEINRFGFLWSTGETAHFPFIELHVKIA